MNIPYIEKNTPGNLSWNSTNGWFVDVSPFSKSVFSGSTWEFSGWYMGPPFFSRVQ